MTDDEPVPPPDPWNTHRACRPPPLNPRRAKVREALGSETIAFLGALNLDLEVLIELTARIPRTIGTI